MCEINVGEFKGNQMNFVEMRPETVRSGFFTHLNTCHDWPTNPTPIHSFIYPSHPSIHPSRRLQIYINTFITDLPIHPYMLTYTHKSVASILRLHALSIHLYISA